MIIAGRIRQDGRLRQASAIPSASKATDRPKHPSQGLPRRPALALRHLAPCVAAEVCAYGSTALDAADLVADARHLSRRSTVNVVAHDCVLVLICEVVRFAQARICGSEVGQFPTAAVLRLVSIYGLHPPQRSTSHSQPHPLEADRSAAGRSLKRCHPGKDRGDDCQSVMPSAATGFDPSPADA